MDTDPAVYRSPAEGVGTIRENSHSVSSAIHIKDREIDDLR